MLLPPDMPDPRDKAMIDAFVEVNARERSGRAWSFWLTVAAVSLGMLWSVRIEFIPNALRLLFAVLGGVGLLLFLAFLSMKPFGRNLYAGPEWWWP